jgi:gamma-glutamyltranspeptidase/glutathione hydrolase
MRVEVVYLATACAVDPGGSPACGDGPAGAAPHPSLAEGENGLVVGLTGKRAVHSGLEILKQGGSAADAAIATAMTQVVEAAGEYVSFVGILSMGTTTRPRKSVTT